MKRDKAIVLVNPPSFCVEDDRTEPPLGLLYIAAVLQENDYENITLYDMAGCRTEEDIVAKIKHIPEAYVYGITCFCTNYHYAKRTIERIQKEIPQAFIALGGPNPTGIPEFTFRDSGADVIITGEGEDTFAEGVTQCLSFNEINGIVKGRAREDIDMYPFPARGIVDMNTYSRRLMGQPVISLLSSRGCKYRCIHCNSNVMGGGSRAARYRSSQNILMEIKSLRDRYRYFRFNDDHFTGNPNLPELLEQIKPLDIQFRAFARIEDLNNKTCKLLKEAGCVHLAIGLESLNPDNLRILGKASQIGLEKNLHIAKSHGLTTRVSFMVGLPFDTDETITKYFQKAAKLSIDEFAVYPLIPYPGSQIWKTPERFDYKIVDRDFTKYVQMGYAHQTCYALKHKNFGPDKVEAWKILTEKIFEDNSVKHMRKSEIAQ